MIRSMTGFSRREWHHDTGSYHWEIRSVNHRFLELGFRLPESVRDAEPELREKARSLLSRGKVDVTLHYHPAESAHPQVTVHQGLLKKLIDVHTEIAALVPHAATVDTMQLMRWPGVLAIGNMDLGTIKTVLLTTFTQALTDLTQDREREGRELQRVISQRLDSMQQYATQVKDASPHWLEQQRNKLKMRIEQLQAEIDPTRLEQEIVLIAQRSDVAEEVDRLLTHIQQTRAVLQQEGAVGRRLDFLVQEMHREANTLGSKATDMQMTQLSVELKVLIEQIREQVQNIE